MAKCADKLDFRETKMHPIMMSVRMLAKIDKMEPIKVITAGESTIFVELNQRDESENNGKIEFKDYTELEVNCFLI